MSHPLVKCASFGALLASVVPLVAQPVPAPKPLEFHFTYITPFQSVDTSARGLNNWEVVVGDYADVNQESAQTEAGFLRKGSGRYSHINFRGATDTDAQDINNNGTVLGMYDVIPAAPVKKARFAAARSVKKRGPSLVVGDHGFLLKGDDYHALPDIPPPYADSGADWNALNDEEDVVGVVFTTFNAVTSNHGFVLDDGSYTLFDVPTTADPLNTYTEANGINNARSIVGESGHADGSGSGFLKKGNTYWVFNFPGSTDTIATSINNKGDIAGVYTDVNFQDHGFILRNFPGPNANWTSVDAGKSPANQDTKIAGINDDRDICGTLSARFSDSGSVGFFGELDH